MDDRAASIVLQNIFGSYSNRMKSGMALMRKSIHENYQMTMRFIENPTSVWDSFCKNAKLDITNKVDTYCEYKPKFPTARIKFVKDITQSIITRMVTILDAKESVDSKCSVNISYVDCMKYVEDPMHLELASVYKIVSHSIIINSWRVSMCEYTYGDSETDTRLINGPIDKYIVECSYVGAPKLIYVNFLKLVGMLNSDYDYKLVLLKERGTTKLSLPTVITNKFMNETPISKCIIYDVPNTNFQNIVFYENLWKPLDLAVVESGKEILYKEPPNTNILTSKYEAIIYQAICVKDDNDYKVISENHICHFEKARVINNPKSWESVINNHDMFVVSYDNVLYYYSKTFNIQYSVVGVYKYLTLWSFTVPSYLRYYNRPIELQNKNGSWMLEKELTECSDDETETFNKMAIVYSDVFSPLPKISKLSPIIRLIYQYITETNIIGMPHDMVIHIFDENIISSSELIHMCKMDDLILIGKKPSVVNYFDFIIHSKTICSLYSNTLLSSQFPNIEVANNFDINSLIRETSFVNNSVDILYLQNSFDNIDTLPKMIKFKEATNKILSKRGRLYIAFFNADVLNIERNKNAFVDDLINCLFEPAHVYTKQRRRTSNENIFIKRNVDAEELDEIYMRRKRFDNVFTVVYTPQKIETDDFHTYSLEDGYLYVMYPKSLEYIDIYEKIIKSKQLPINSFELEPGIKYYAISQCALELFGKCLLKVVPYKTRVLTNIISRTETFAHLLNSQYEKIFNSLQLNIY